MSLEYQTYQLLYVRVLPVQSPDLPTNRSQEQDHQEDGEKGSNKPLDDTVKPTQNHFQRR